MISTIASLSSTIKSKAMKDTAPGPDGIPYSVYNKLWEQAGPLIKRETEMDKNKLLLRFLFDD